MREIKFRAWKKDYDTGKFYMVPWEDQFFSNSSPVTHFSDYFPDPEDEDVILMQYTGLKDKHGKDIYEGDIVTFDGNMTTDDSMGIEPNGYIYDEESIHSVVWNDKLAAWELDFDEGERRKYKNHTRSLLVDGKCEVIGNIHENPELLGGK